MKFLLTFVINFYKKHISPYKRFSCAYRIHTGQASCSTLGLRAILRYGSYSGLKVLRQRLMKCGVAHHRYSNISVRSRKQGGYCDVPCDLSFDDLTSCCDSCDGGGWASSKKNQDDLNGIYIPPKFK